ncbi:MAG: hypothetical protein JNK05_07280 [Myxococcales bacterium]|nr:hypothetical protein [Myxococcales bacterium]
MAGATTGFGVRPKHIAAIALAFAALFVTREAHAQQRDAPDESDATPRLRFLPNHDAVTLEAIDESEIAPAQREERSWGLWRRLCIGPCTIHVEPWWSLRLRDGSRTIHDPFRLQPGGRTLYADVASPALSGFATAGIIVGAAGAVIGGLLTLSSPTRFENPVIAISGLVIGGIGGLALGFSAPNLRDEQDRPVQPSEVANRSPVVEDAPDIVRPGGQRERGVIWIEGNDPHIQVQREIASGTTQDLSTGVVATTTVISRFETVCDGPCSLALPPLARIRVVGPGITTSSWFTVEDNTSRIRVRVGRPWQIAVSVLSGAAALGFIAGGAAYWSNNPTEVAAGVTLLSLGGVFIGGAIGFGVVSQTSLHALQ